MGARNFAALLVAACCIVSAAGQNATLPSEGTPSFSYILAYNALIQVYDAYKYGVPLSGLQAPFNDSLFYVACQTLAANPLDNVIYLHPTFPLGQTIRQLSTSGFPLAPNLANAVNAAANKRLGDRKLFEAMYPYGPAGTGSVATFTKSVLGITIYGTLNDTGKIFTCSTGTTETSLS